MNTDIQTISQSGMLGAEETQALATVSKSLGAGFERRQRFRPRFLMETAVLNDMKFPTPDSKYWQCNVERDTHFRNLAMLAFDYQEKQADIEIIEAEVEMARVQVSPPPNRLAEAMINKQEIQIARENALLVYMKKEAQERVREIMNWSDIMKKLEPELKHDPNDVEAHMPETYAIRAGRELEIMQLAEGQSDMSGAMNIISMSRTIAEHDSVKQLVEG